MATIKERAVDILGKDNTQQQGVFVWQEFDSNERLIRAVKLLLSAWALAGVALFIPLAHFILVPGLLIAGPVLAYSKYAMQRCSDQVKGVCPVCCERIVLKVEAKDVPPLWTYCPQCKNPLQIKEQ